MNKENKVKNNVIEPLLDGEKLRLMVKENTEAMMKSIIEGTLKKELKHIITEDFSDYEEEVEDDSTETPIDNNSEESMDTEETAQEDEVEGLDNVGGEDAWNEFDQYKVDDETYDLRNGSGDDFIKVYRLMKDSDQFIVPKDLGDGKIQIVDNESGNEYIIDTNSASNTDEVQQPEDEIETEEDEAVYEINMDGMESNDLQEYNSNVGYTTTYQDDTAMTTGGVSEPSKGNNDWDKGVPTSGDSTRRYGKPGEGKPFTENEDVEDDVITEEDEIELDEAGVSRTQRNLVRISKKNQEVKDSSRADFNDTARDGNKKFTSEQKLKQLEKEINTIKEKNKVLKEVALKLKTLAETYHKDSRNATMVNYKMAKMVDLVTENVTTIEEKRNIVATLDKAKTVEQINNIYESFKREFNNKPNLMEGLDNIDKPFTTSSKKINETPIYANNEVKESINFMNRLMKI